MGLLGKLQERWGLNSIGRVIVVLLVFTCTGFTVMFLRRPILGLIPGSDSYPTVFTITYYIVILPVYFVILLIYGFIFGQYEFFSTLVKKTLNRMKRKKSENDK